MAKTTVRVTLKPAKDAVSLPALKDHIELVESLIDASITAPVDVDMKLDTDYDDDARILVATWEI